MTPHALADRIAALDWSGVSLQHRLAVTAACETLRNSPNFKGLENGRIQHTNVGVAIVAFGSDHRGSNNSNSVQNDSVIPFRAPSAELLRGAEYNSDKRVMLTRLDGTPAATALLARGERRDWIVETTCELCNCDPERVAFEDDTVTVDGLPVFSC